jgi:transcription initiation factor TFIID subunit TAF12
VLNMADEHIDMALQMTCLLARHRKSDTIDRKDVQLAYGE